MASIAADPNGRKRILFMGSDSRRRTIRLGKATAEQADAFRTKIEALNADLIVGRPHDDEVSRWLRSLDKNMRLRLQSAGLLQLDRGGELSLGEYLDEYFGSLTVKASTQVVYGHTRRCLTEFFESRRLLRSILACGR